MQISEKMPETGYMRTNQEETGADGEGGFPGAECNREGREVFGDTAKNDTIDRRSYPLRHTGDVGAVLAAMLAEPDTILKSRIVQNAKLMVVRKKPALGWRP